MVVRNYQSWPCRQIYHRAITCTLDHRELFANADRRSPWQRAHTGLNEQTCNLMLKKICNLFQTIQWADTLHWGKLSICHLGSRCFNVCLLTSTPIGPGLLGLQKVQAPSLLDCRKPRPRMFWAILSDIRPRQRSFTTSSGLQSWSQQRGKQHWRLSEEKQLKNENKDETTPIVRIARLPHKKWLIALTSSQHYKSKAF